MVSPMSGHLSAFKMLSCVMTFQEKLWESVEKAVLSIFIWPRNLFLKEHFIRPVFHLRMLWETVVCMNTLWWLHLFHCSCIQSCLQAFYCSLYFCAYQSSNYSAWNCFCPYIMPLSHATISSPWSTMWGWWVILTQLGKKGVVQDWVGAVGKA